MNMVQIRGAKLPVVKLLMYFAPSLYQLILTSPMNTAVNCHPHITQVTDPPLLVETPMKLHLETGLLCNTN